MYSICKKELNQFFSSLTGYVAIILFLLINGIFLFVLKDSSLFESGYASLDKFFELAPWVAVSCTGHQYAFLVGRIPCRYFLRSCKQGHSALADRGR